MNSIDSLRREGLGYKRIAAIMGLSIDTVKSYCMRHPLAETNSEVRCKQCDVLVEQTPHRNKKQFCSDESRMTWWNAHPEMVKRKTTDTLVCRYCGNQLYTTAARQESFPTVLVTLIFEGRERDA